MILQALYDYYQRKASDPESKIAPYGFEWKEIPFLIVIDEQGNFVNLEDTREGEGKNKRIKSYLLPRAVLRTIKIIPQLLWDKEEYLLGTSTEVDAKHTSFKNLILNLPDYIRQDAGVNAVINFYNKNGIEYVTQAMNWKDVISAKNPFMTFKLAGEINPIPCLETIRESVRLTQQETPDNLDDSADTDTSLTIKAICLITGQKETIARTHRKTFINKDANTLVSFQKNSGYDSYGKIQAYNAPISLSGEDAYTTSLKMLLEKGSKNKFNIGGTIFIFWAEKDNLLEDNFSFFFNKPPIDNPDRGIQAIKSLFESIHSGKFNTEGETKFYLLGLCPGGGTRIAIRLWKTGTVKDFAEKIAGHFTDLEIIHGKNDEREYFSLFNLLSNIVLEYKVDNLPPNLAGKVIECILDGSPYPATLQQQCLRRIRAEQKVNRIRAAILKGYLNRFNRFHYKNEKEITMALDLENTNQGYLCGRLFAVLEKIQEEAQPGINSTIKDRYYGAASSTPITVFGRLVNLTGHHLVKLHPGRKTNLEKLIQEVMSPINSNGMPAHLSLDDQSRFAIGYYHQRQALFTAKADK
ncbi:MAG: type I-C CRISPR-associated protein Cas8c/Csd1 [Candidatus Margulisiibacteriota bacterium]|jgi:CRISPR-associated protein Csd1